VEIQQDHVVLLECAVDSVEIVLQILFHLLEQNAMQRTTVELKFQDHAMEHQYLARSTKTVTSQLECQCINTQISLLYLFLFSLP